MNKKTPSIYGSTVTHARGIEPIDKLTPAQRAEIKASLDNKGFGTGSGDQQWGRVDQNLGTPLVQKTTDQFSFTTGNTDNDPVTVNGKRYPNMHAVPLTERARIEVLRAQSKSDAEWLRSLKSSGQSASQNSATRTSVSDAAFDTFAQRNAAQSNFGSASNSSMDRSIFESTAQFGTGPSGFTTQVPDPAASPGAVAPSRIMRRIGQIFLIVLLLQAAWMAGRWYGVF